MAQIFLLANSWEAKKIRTRNEEGNESEPNKKELTA
jgi:hypothetical protein